MHVTPTISKIPAHISYDRKSLMSLGLHIKTMCATCLLSHNCDDRHSFRSHVYRPTLAKMLEASTAAVKEKDFHNSVKFMTNVFALD
jgi:hypothetical protein